MTDSPNIMRAKLDWDGDIFTLQHPGVRAWMLKYQEFVLDHSTIQVVPFLDWCFDEVVLPEKGEKLSLESILPNKVMDWATLLQGFLMRGELYSSYKWSNIEGKGLTIEQEGKDELGRSSEERVVAALSGSKRSPELQRDAKDK